MPLWVSLSLLAGLSSSVSNIFYRTTLKGEQDAALSTWLLQICRMACAIAFVIWLHITFTLQSVIILLCLGFVEIVGVYTYMRMHAMSALSVSSIIQRTRILWTAILAAIFVGEAFTPLEVAGLLILFVGVSVVAAPQKLREDKGILFAYVSAIMFSVTTVLIKATLSSIPPAAQVVGLAAPSIIVFPLITKGFGARFRRFTSERLWMKLIAAFGNVAGLFLTVYAYAVGPAAKASAIFQGSLVLGVFAGIILLGEKKDIWPKVVGSVVVLLGIVTVSL